MKIFTTFQENMLMFISDVREDLWAQSVSLVRAMLPSKP